mmetsp:Transcript_30337/g.60264  ORF Transcript_30337/g.60264 Transcript_30337/m.60264 type:complete len:365 (+) Transcript_30337:139-1233(+)
MSALSVAALTLSEPSPAPAAAAAPTSLSSQLNTAVSLIDSCDYASASPLLTNLAASVSSLALFSKNESLDDITTKSLPMLAVPYHMAVVRLAVAGVEPRGRMDAIESSEGLMKEFLSSLLSSGLLEGEQKSRTSQSLDSDSFPAPPREVKVAQFKALRAAESKLEHLQSKVAAAADDDGAEATDNDDDVRELEVTRLRLYAWKCHEEMQNLSREKPMLKMALAAGPRPPPSASDERAPPPFGAGRGGIKKTVITRENIGSYVIEAQRLKDGVFKPGWNLPTMSLQELGERELRDAMERQEREKIAEEEEKKKPRKYEYLVKDGLEDDADLVDASAQKDREWDDFKDANKRGWGNKKGDRGDRNF